MSWNKQQVKYMILALTANVRGLIFFILMHPAMFSCIINKRKYSVHHNTFMLCYILLHVSVRINHHQAILVTTI